eukprot:CAMPEP_0194751622 /NCGR_PEP_ID=MMETSP0323_2-20130528/5624_1 /TAXON_ID=2866 ORGANISM="Crypthecodinium cohnii, Strain Seligo" /NCGR_SAMPLE_ID=MMETSP0323_2 /ASSEMBLY_ACC=CAM_ASM_000346 /LENGTH=149 /DNA_ID=CAMNT_0039668189 /DNA_START=93 /DNA_END=539 /DNA_ORIENTATION=-
MVGWDEFLTMYQRCIADSTGMEPRNLFNLAQFLMYDKEQAGQISVEQTLQIIFVRRGRGELDDEIREIFGEKQKADDGQELKISFSQFLHKANERLTKMRWTKKEVSKAPGNRRVDACLFREVGAGQLGEWKFAKWCEWIVDLADFEAA